MSKVAWIFGWLVLLALPPLASAQEDGLVVHEWGVLSTLEGQDGQVLGGPATRFNELPGFVLRWRSVPMGEKMIEIEKPILYVYTQRKHSLDIKVSLPDGLWREWWPPAETFGPRITQGAPRVPPKGAFLHWPVVRVAARGSSPKTRPREVGGAGWYPKLRTPDANWLTVAGTNYSTPGGDISNYRETEKFLLYRGLATSERAVELGLAHADGKLSLANKGRQALGKVLLLKIEGQRGWLQVVEAPAAGQTQLAPPFTGEGLALDALAAEAGKRFQRWVEAAGLYPKEAAAMTSIWGQEWFRDPGLRAVYLVPRATVDAFCPLAIKPEPDKTVRVLAARIESRSPQLKARVEQWIKRLDARKWRDRARAQQKLRELGHFARPLLEAALRDNPSTEARHQIETLLRALKPQRD